MEKLQQIFASTSSSGGTFDFPIERKYEKSQKMRDVHRCRWCRNHVIYFA